MGACDFGVMGHGKEAKQVFNSLVSEARHMEGHGGYTGSIAEKSSYVVIQWNPVPLSEAMKIGNDLIDAEDPRIDDKWGPAGAIPVCKDGKEIIGWYFFGWASS